MGQRKSARDLVPNRFSLSHACVVLINTTFHIFVTERKIYHVFIHLLLLTIFNSADPSAMQGRLSLMNSVKWPRSPWVLVDQLIKCPPSVQEVMGSIPVWDLDFFFPVSCHVDQYTFHNSLPSLKFTISNHLSVISIVRGQRKLRIYW